MRVRVIDDSTINMDFESIKSLSPVSRCLVICLISSVMPKLCISRLLRQYLRTTVWLSSIIPYSFLCFGRAIIIINQPPA
jgi:hypothetical protein